MVLTSHRVPRHIQVCRVAYDCLNAMLANTEWHVPGVRRPRGITPYFVHVSRLARAHNAFDDRRPVLLQELDWRRAKENLAPLWSPWDVPPLTVLREDQWIPPEYDRASWDHALEELLRDPRAACILDAWEYHPWAPLEGRRTRWQPDERMDWWKAQCAVMTEMGLRAPRPPSRHRRIVRLTPILTDDHWVALHELAHIYQIPTINTLAEALAVGWLAHEPLPPPPTARKLFGRVLPENRQRLGRPPKLKPTDE